MFLGVAADQEGWDVDHLLSNADVALFDEDTCVVDRFGECEFEHFGLEATLKKFLCGELQNEIQLLLILTKKTVGLHLAQNGGTLKKSLGILLWKSEQVTGSLTNFCKSKLDTPDLSFATKTVLTAKFEFLVKTFLLVSTAWCLVALAVVASVLCFHHVDCCNNN